MASIEYLAGFIDGEGSIQISRSTTYRSGKRHYYLRLSVHQVDRRPLDELNVRWPGSLRLNPGRGNSKPVWEWVVSGTTAADVVSTLRPFLIGKAEQADLALAFQAMKGGRGWPQTTEEQLNAQEALYNQMAVLKGTQALRESRRRLRNV